MAGRSRRAHPGRPISLGGFDVALAIAGIAAAAVFGVAEVSAQATRRPRRGKAPSAKDNSISVNVFLRDAGKNEVLLATRIWPGYPDYNAFALQQFFATMKALEPAYKQDDDVAYTWSTKGKVTKCSIYLESAEAPVKNGTGAIVGCEANGVSNLAVTSVADPKHPVSTSLDPEAPERRDGALQEAIGARQGHVAQVTTPVVGHARSIRWKPS